MGGDKSLLGTNAMAHKSNRPIFVVLPTLGLGAGANRMRGLFGGDCSRGETCARMLMSDDGGAGENTTCCGANLRRVECRLCCRRAGGKHLSALTGVPPAVAVHRRDLDALRA